MFTGRLDALPDTISCCMFQGASIYPRYRVLPTAVRMAEVYETYEVVRPFRLKYWDIQLMSAGRHTQTTAPC